ncbi:MULTISPECIES: exodeoxyribonuclease III [unclassified Micromonospora]|uniref:exodeoxyribonuclease III n=1 Tax=unclassified Micromonospora TaxID=2617518 RepID=UPI00098D4A93|nr:MULTISPECIES: exodeoxyribonuclease III [unclassified Micromonospora]MDI5939978.1 exodeoxyribonuclease III [Micromonospora sp. DH15]OON31038.1 exodeoxyribonuclease III [Micromonospora sp. Rc5]
MRLATWNVNSVKARLPRLLDWLATTVPDVVCLQETKCPDGAFPVAEVGELGYTVASHSDGRWNGVAILSRVGLADVTVGFPGEPGFPEPEARAVSATCDGLRVWSVYVPNGRALDDPHYAYKLAWFAALRDALEQELTGGLPLAVCGDFNVAPTDADVWDPALFVTSTHVTPAERAALAALRDLGLADVVPTPMKGPHPFTYWDYRAGMFHQNKGMRIDLVYASAPFARAVRAAYVDREARKGKGPSDHAPIVVDADLVPAVEAF